MTGNYRSGVLAALHGVMDGFQQSAAIDRETMREVDEAFLTSVEAFSSDEIRAMGERESISRPASRTLS